MWGIALTFWARAQTDRSLVAHAQSHGQPTRSLVCLLSIRHDGRVLGTPIPLGSKFTNPANPTATCTLIFMSASESNPAPASPSEPGHGIHCHIDSRHVVDEPLVWRPTWSMVIGPRSDRLRETLCKPPFKTPRIVASSGVCVDGWKRGSALSLHLSTLQHDQHPSWQKTGNNILPSSPKSSRLGSSSRLGRLILSFMAWVRHRSTAIQSCKAITETSVGYWPEYPAIIDAMSDTLPCGTSIAVLDRNVTALGLLQRRANWFSKYHGKELVDTKSLNWYMRKNKS